MTFDITKLIETIKLKIPAPIRSFYKKQLQDRITSPFFLLFLPYAFYFYAFGRYGGRGEWFSGGFWTLQANTFMFTLITSIYVDKFFRSRLKNPDNLPILYGFVLINLTIYGHYIHERLFYTFEKIAFIIASVGIVYLLQQSKDKA